MNDLIFTLIFYKRELSAVLMNGIPEVCLSKHSKIKGHAGMKEWCVANTLDSKDFLFFYPKKE